MTADQQGYRPVTYLLGPNPPTLQQRPLSEVDEVEAVSLAKNLGDSEYYARPPEFGDWPVDELMESGNDTIVVLASWRSYLEGQYASKTVAMYWNTAMRFFSRHPISINSITEEHVFAYLQKFPHRSSTRRTYYQGLKNLFGWAHRRGFIERDPMVFVKTPTVEEKVPRAMSEAEVVAVVQAAYARSRHRGAALKLLYFTAARVGEAVTIAWSDVNEERLILHGHKNGKERIVDMTDGLLTTLTELHDWSGTYDLVIPRTEATVWQWCRTAGKDAGIERVHPHLFRSTAATAMLRSGGRVHAVSSVLGHSSIKTTQRYLAVDEDDRKLALAGLAVAGL